MRSLWMIMAALLLVSACKKKKSDGEACAEQTDCQEELACEQLAGRTQCVRCETWPGCQERGECIDSNVGVGCWATDEAHCKQSEGCKKRGACTLTRDYRCLSDKAIHDEQVEEGRREERQRGGVGCPCGCDRSKQMVAELEELGAKDAVARVDRTLDIIGEREDAGYITEAMVQHRLRLLAFRARLPDAPARATPAVPAAIRQTRDARRELPANQSAHFRVQHELRTFGQITETVHGREKLQRACFRWWLRIENLTAEAVTVAPPSIDATVPFPVSRWYLEDGDGEPWDGRLEPGAAASVLVIGYLGQPVKPDTDIAATMKLQKLLLHANARARSRWNDVGG